MILCDSSDFDSKLVVFIFCAATKLSYVGLQAFHKTVPKENASLGQACGVGIASRSGVVCVAVSRRACRRRRCVKSRCCASCGTRAWCACWTCCSPTTSCFSSLSTCTWISNASWTSPKAHCRWILLRYTPHYSGTYLHLLPHLLHLLGLLTILPSRFT